MAASATPTSSLDEVIYLASLVSNVKEVDSILDGVRVITASVDRGQSLSPQDEAELQKIRRELKDYLINREPLRSFTPEELEYNLRDRLDPADRQRRLRVSLWGFLITAFALPGLIMGALRDLPLATRGQVAAFSMLMTFGLGAGWFFITALRNFKPALKRAYAYIALGALLSGLNEVQLPIAAYYNLESSPWLHYGGFTAPFMITNILIYLGLRIYARTVGLRSWAASLPLAIMGALTLAVLVTILPHASQPNSEAFFDFSLAVGAAQWVLATLIAILAFKLVRRVSRIYAQAMSFTLAFSLVTSVATIIFNTTLFVRGSLFGPAAAIAAIPYMLTAVLMLVTGYRFKKTSLY